MSDTPFTHPIDPASQCFLCTPQRPMPANRPKGSRWAHSNIVAVGRQRDGYPGGDIQTYRCTDCGHQWDTELPQ